MTESKIHSSEPRSFKWVIKDHFAREPFDGRGCNVHRRTKETSTEVAIFIHGFRGQGYETWEGSSNDSFPGMVFGADDEAPIDISIFRYNTGIIGALTRSVHLERAAKRLSRAIEELSGTYKSIYLICHSLGALRNSQCVDECVECAAVQE